jgi:pimeloyl-ACP methyl ester carboxylesterase
MMPQINWRSTLTFDDGQSLASGVEKSEGSGSTQYTLKDITPETIPAVRNLISDVMLDIPYYLSHHKPKMIQAVIKEANRVYRLWCRNNPGFEKTGKVNLIAHSLGSVMALDILSKQPTRLPQQPDLRGKRVRDNMFEFDTRNLFLCGSPAGFFLLLNKGPSQNPSLLVQSPCTHANLKPRHSNIDPPQGTRESRPRRRDHRRRCRRRRRHLRLPGRRQHLQHHALQRP